jgi:hypothetical protein
MASGEKRPSKPVSKTLHSKYPDTLVVHPDNFCMQLLESLLNYLQDK